MGTQFEVVELVGTSNTSSSDAIKAVVLDAHKDFGVAWFEVLEERGRVNENNEIEFQVKIKVGRKK